MDSWRSRRWDGVHEWQPPDRRHGIRSFKRRSTRSRRARDPPLGEALGIYRKLSYARRLQFFRAATAASSASSTHREYWDAVGCRPSSATQPWCSSHEVGVTSPQCAPPASVSARPIALKWSISRAILARSLPAANRVTPQSGIESTITRDGFPAANSTARATSDLNSARYFSASRPRY